MNYRDSVALARWTSPRSRFAASAQPLHLGDGQRGEIPQVLSVLGGLRGLARRVGGIFEADMRYLPWLNMAWYGLVNGILMSSIWTGNELEMNGNGWRWMEIIHCGNWSLSMFRPYIIYIYIYIIINPYTVMRISSCIMGCFKISFYPSS